MTPILRGRAKAMRREPTEAEQRLWRLLRSRRLSQLKFRRQVPMGNYIVDFICFDRRLIVEADGTQHLENAYDQVRDAWLKAQGYRVLRLWNADILRDPESTLNTVLAAAGKDW